MKRLAERIIRYRWIVIAGFILITLGFTSQIPKVEIDTDIKSQLPKNMPSRVDTDTIDEIFGGTEMLMVLIQTDDVLNPETLKRVEKLSRKIKRIKEVEKVLSIFELKSIYGKDGAMIVEPAVNRIPQNEEDREALRKTIQENDIVYGSVISKDFTLTAVIAMLKNNVRDDVILPKFRKIISKTPGKETVMLGGLPATRAAIGANIKRDMRQLLPIGILIMLVFLFVCFRQLRGVVLPFVIVVMSILVSIGLLSLIGWKFHMVTTILPIFLIAVANDYGIHMIAKYQEDNVPSNNFSRKELAQRMFQSLGKPVLLTGLTTIAGMLCLLGHILIPAKQLGILTAFGISFALMASLFFIPAIMSLLPRSRPVLVHISGDPEKKPTLERLLWFFGRLVSEKPKWIILTAAILAVVSAVGVFFVVVDTNPNGYYRKDNPVVIVNDLIDTHLGGSQNISIVYQGDIKDPKIVQKIDDMERSLGNMEEVGNTTSIARVIRQMSRALNDPGDPMYDRIPKTRNGVAQYFELYSMSGDPEDLEKLVDFPFKHAIVTARINKTSTAVLRRVVERLKNRVKDDPDVLLVGGFGVVLSDLARAVVNGQILSLFMATGVVALLLMILFRSPIAGLIAAIPLALSILILFGLMGVFGIELNIVNAILSSIMIGVGVDYTIHFLWRYREERKAGLDYVPSVKKTLTTTGRGIIFNAFSVIVGFTVLLFSSFLPVQFFGFLVVVSILACLIGALVLVPALCLIFKPKFLEPIQ